MKRVLSIVLLALILVTCVLSFTACGFQYHRVGVIKDSIGRQFMNGNTQKGFYGYSMDTNTYKTPEEAEQIVVEAAQEYFYEC